MIDIALLRENPEAVKENMIKKFQQHKLHIVDEVLDVDKKCREYVTKGSTLRGQKNDLSKQIGICYKNKEIDKANEIKLQIAKIDKELEELETLEQESIKHRTELMMKIPNFIDPEVPIGEDDTHNVELKKFGKQYN